MGLSVVRSSLMVSPEMLYLLSVSDDKPDRGPREHTGWCLDLTCLHDG